MINGKSGATVAGTFPEHGAKAKNLSRREESRREWRGILWLLAWQLVLAALAAWMGGSVISLLFYAGMILLFYEVAVFFFCLRVVRAERTLSATRLMAGDELGVRIRMDTRRRFALSWLVLRDRSDLEDQCSLGRAEFQESDLAGDGLEYRIYDLKRGRYFFREMECVAGDFFGLTERIKRIPGTETVVVYPRVRPLPDWETWLDREQERQKRAYSVSLSGAFSGLRHYRPGDRLQVIDWKASARGQGLKVKEFERESAEELVIVLDQRAESYRGLPEEVFERAVSFVASLANEAAIRQIAASVYLTGKNPVIVRVGVTRDHVVNLLEHLVDVRPDGGKELSGFFKGGKGKWVVVTPARDASLLSFLWKLMRSGTEVEVAQVQEAGFSPVSEDIWQRAGIPVRPVPAEDRTRWRFAAR
jgi:uncharacterized protein (DUF58 family)